MASWFDELFGGGHRAVRRDAHVYVTDEQDGHPTTTPASGEAFLLSPEGSIDRVRLSRFWHCGHTTDVPAGGQCGEPSCRMVSCQSCHVVCCCCLRPLCPEHLYSATDKTGQRQPFCWRCYDDLQWQVTVGRIWYALTGRTRER
jgi:hypothetical protein